MANARLIIRSPAQAERIVEINGEVAIGRAPDNGIRIDDPLVSQYHAVIERRGDSFWLSDLGSTNGTAVNGEPVTAERQLQNGDLIFTGDTAYATFEQDGDSPTRRRSAELQEGPVAGGSAASSGPAARPSQAASTSRVSPWLVIAAAMSGIVLAGGMVLLAVNAFTDPETTVRVLSPETGATVRGPQVIRVDVEEIKGIDEVIYLLDGVEFASAGDPPFEATLDPAQLQAKVRNLASGNHVLTVTVQDKDGNRTPQPDTILLAFDVAGTSPDPGDAKRGGEPADNQSFRPSPPPGPPDVAALSRNLAATISGKSWYDFDPQLADEIRRRTAAYRINVMDDASRYRRQIGNAFNSKGLPPAIGFVLASSESQFKEAAEASASGSNGRGIGFWQVPRQIALEQGYILPDESAAALGDVRRSAEIAAAYINDLINAFGGLDHFMYAIACYGMPLDQAAKVRARLEEIDPAAADRRDFWRMAKAGVVPRGGVERVAKFFAAGIVGENPQAFGLNARPLSSLY
jgi:hypothetical protein